MYSATVGYSELSNEETQGHPDSGPFYNQPGGGGVTKSYPTLEIYLLKKKSQCQCHENKQTETLSISTLKETGDVTTK